MITQADIARKIFNRAYRLQRLIELEAPQIIIENERKLIENALSEWPVVDKAAHAEARVDMRPIRDPSRPWPENMLNVRMAESGDVLFSRSGISHTIDQEQAANLAAHIVALLEADAHLQFSAWVRTLEAGR